MRFLLPFILIGALLASQIVLASGVSSSVPIRFCMNRAQERRAVRLLRAHRTPNCQQKNTASSSPSSSFTSSVSSVPSSRSAMLPTDSLVDTDIRSQFLLLGEVGPILGAASIFIEEEPVQVTSIAINITQETTTVGALLVYDDQRHFLGTALLDPSTSTNRTYNVTLSSDALTVEKREDRTIYVRPRLMRKDSGGQSNQIVQISSMVVKANGVWSNQQYTKVSSSSDRFPEFITARAAITSVRRIGDATAALTSGTQKMLGAFEIAGRKTDASAHISITNLVFHLEQTGGVSLVNVNLVSDGFNEKFPCTVSSTDVICSAIPDLYGSATDQPRRLMLYGDITLSDSLHAGLRLTLNAAGDSGTDGSIVWNDGSTSFGWVALPEPVAEGAYYKY